MWEGEGTYRNFLVTTTMTSSWTQALNKNVTNMAEERESL
jgi:hypothetical protein